jgi:eukaryotic-like serine/threonine-protein kinase
MDAWIYALDRGPLVRMTYHPAQDGYPVWSPDGKRVVFWSRQGGAVTSLYVRSSDLTGSEERLASGTNGRLPFCWSSDGKVVVFQEYSSETGTDIGIVSVGTEQTSRLLLNSKSDEARPALSPDGRWMAYQSNLSGRVEVYVQRFPDLGTRWQLTTEGGESPIWSTTGREIFYRRGRAVMSLPVTINGETFTHGTPRVLFEGPYVLESSAAGARSYALAPDGRFLMMKAAGPEGNDTQQIIVALNWPEELKRLIRRQ